MTENLTPVDPRGPVHEDEAGPSGLGLLEGTKGLTSLRELATEKAPTPAMPGHLIHVVLDDGQEWTVRVDNRDFIRWDHTAPRQKWSAQTQPFLFQTFLAWAASHRQGLTALQFAQFQDAALETKDVKADEDDAARPTQ